MNQEKDIAETYLAEWIETFEAQEFDDDTRALLLRGINSGRLDLNKGTEEFTLKLIKPVELDNGEVIEAMKISEPSVHQLRESQRDRDDFTKSLKLLAAITGHPVGVLERLKSRDMTLAGAVMGFFI